MIKRVDLRSDYAFRVSVFIELSWSHIRQEMYKFATDPDAKTAWRNFWPCAQFQIMWIPIENGWISLGKNCRTTVNVTAPLQGRAIWSVWVNERHAQATYFA